MIKSEAQHVLGQDPPSDQAASESHQFFWHVFHDLLCYDTCTKLGLQFELQEPPPPPPDANPSSVLKKLGIVNVPSQNSPDMHVVMIHYVPIFPRYYPSTNRVRMHCYCHPLLILAPSFLCRCLASLETRKLHMLNSRTSTTRWIGALNIVPRCRETSAVGLQMAFDGFGRIIYLTPSTVCLDTWQTALSILGIVVAATKLDGDPALPSRPLTGGRVCPPLQLTLQEGSSWLREQSCQSLQAICRC